MTIGFPIGDTDELFCLDMTSPSLNDNLNLCTGGTFIFLCKIVEEANGECLKPVSTVHPSKGPLGCFQNVYALSHFEWVPPSRTYALITPATIANGVPNADIHEANSHNKSLKQTIVEESLSFFDI
ncbi:hypothetical protein VNO77_20118 [Canavalia gladiata]|uniref:Uncharacterized protein n=1 Tax=Canavalia gladiata TaxID=3824 RepID=A0AAN9LNR8_CANGL